MANLSSLVHELRERIAASSSSPSHPGDGPDPLESRFRAVLPNLLQAYVLPSSTANEREVTAVLKLLAHTARNFPGVLFHGKASAVLPVIGRILPFFAEPMFHSRHGVIFETVASLLSLLRTGEREAYRQFFLDAMLLVEDLFYVASLYEGKPNSIASTRVSVKCFHESFAGISSDPAIFSDLPACCRPTDGPGVLINLTEKSRWQPFATWTIKLLSKCLTDGTLYVEGLISASFVSVACSLLCYGDAALHMACFDFSRITAAVMNAEIVPSENLIRSISCILGHDNKELSMFRSTAYDSSMGACLHVLHSSCPNDVVEFTAGELISVFQQSLQSTESPELMVAMCSAYIRIAKICPPRIWRPGILVDILSSSKLCMPLINCIRVSIGLLGLDHVGEVAVDIIEGLPSSAKGLESSAVGEKRPAQDTDNSKSKRQKTDVETLASNAYAHFGCKSLHRQDKEYADYMRGLLVSFVGLLKPGDSKVSSLSEETALVALSVLCIVFCNYPQSTLSGNIFQQMHAWMPWICEQAKRSNILTFDLSIYLEAIDNILLLQSSLPVTIWLFKDDGDGCMNGAETLGCELPRRTNLLNTVLKLPWTHSLPVTQVHNLWKTRCLSVQVASKIGTKLKTENLLELLDLALYDEAEEVRAEAIISMPVIVLCSGHGLLAHMFKRLE